MFKIDLNKVDIRICDSNDVKDIYRLVKTID